MSDSAPPFLYGEVDNNSNVPRSTTIIWPFGQKTKTLADAPVLGNDRYELCEEFAHGGMGTLYLAQDRQLHRNVAIKVLRLDPIAHPEAVGAYANEARVMSYLSHPGVVPIYGCGTTEGGRPYHVMKLVNGVTLAEMLAGCGEWPAPFLSIFADICQTVAFAHSNGVLHLDLKPANIMVGAFGETYVMDWGLARFDHQADADLSAHHEHDQTAKMKGRIAGTPEYMAPEQARGGPLDARTDVFGLGAILCEILTGQGPYKGDDGAQLYRRALQGAMGEAFENLDVCPTDGALVRLTKRCLEPDHRDRPRDAVAVAREVASYQETALQQAENDMSRFFELSLDLFCIAGFDGHFRRVNENFSRVLGHSRQELLLRPFMDFIHPDDVGQTVQVMNVLNEGEPVVRFKNRYRTANGDYKTLEWMAKAIEHEGIIFAVARDVTPD